MGVIMKTRIITAIVAVLLFTPFIYKGGGWFAFSIAFISLVAMYELYRMRKIKKNWLIMLITAAGLLAVLLPERYSVFFGSVSHVSIFCITFIILLSMTVFIPEDFNFVDVSTLVTGILYIGTSFNFLIEVRDMGVADLLYLFCVVWSSDAGAYFVGRAIGKHKFAPLVSPNKTIEGAVGGVITSVIVSQIYRHLIPLALPIHRHQFLIPITLALLGQLGDLVASAYKRHFNVKDTGNILPGHGGMLDRFDSIMFASIALRIWLNFFR